MTSEVADSAGRIFQNPLSPHEIWVNIGRYEEHYSALSKYPRIYPQHEPILQTHISKENFDSLIALLREHVERVPLLSESCTQFLCVCTCALCFCPYVYTQYEYRKLKRNMVREFSRRTISNDVEVDVRVVNNDELQEAHGGENHHMFVDGTTTSTYDGPLWVDSKGIVLEFEEKAKKKYYRYPAKIPPGVNMILTFPVVIPWPLPIRDVLLQNDVVLQEPKSSAPLVFASSTE